MGAPCRRPVPGHRRWLRPAIRSVRILLEAGAWIVSAGVYAAHIGYEHFRIRSSLHSTALHVAFGAAIGAFGLAAIANVHSLLTGTGNLRLLRLALLIWPLITGVPAYVVAFVFTAVLFRVLRRRAAIAGN